MDRSLLFDALVTPKEDALKDLIANAFKSICLKAIITFANAATNN